MKHAFTLLPLILLTAAGQVSAACHISHSPFGTMADGQSVALWQVDDGQIGAGILTLGGILHDLDVPDAHGHSANVVRNLDSLGTYEKRDNFSSLIGRYANRIGGGGITLDGRFYPLPGNAKGVITHGGAKSFGARLWQARALKPGEGCGIELSLVSPDGDNGFPGALGVTVRYRLQGLTLRLDYRARTTKTTVVNLTDHAYFNLAGEGDVYGQTLEIKASHYLPLDHLHLPTGEIAPVANTAYDLETPKPLAGFKKLDDTFVLDGKGLKTAAILHDPKSGRTLTVSTTQAGLVVYTAGSFDGSLRDASGQPIVSGAGVALETQAFPDSPNHANFPSTVLHPGETYQETTVYSFK